MNNYEIDKAKSVREQFAMLDATTSIPTKQWMSLTEIMESGNPLTEDELIRFAKRHPDWSGAVSGAIKNWIKKEEK